VFKELLIDTAIAIIEGLILIKERIYVSLLLRKKIYSQNHDFYTVGYPEIDYILE
jgi:hypothetical protein